MSNKLWRVVRACVELGAENPIQQIHDQGAGGNCNVVKEIIYPLGAEIDIRAIKLGDETMSVLEIWGAEYQENDALLIKPEARGLLEEVCRRERCNMQVCTMHARLKLDCRPPLSSVYHSALPSTIVHGQNKTDHSLFCSGCHQLLMHMHICKLDTLTLDAVGGASNMLLYSQSPSKPKCTQPLVSLLCKTIHCSRQSNHLSTLCAVCFRSLG